VAIWDGGAAVPADDDAVVITAGHAVLMNVDLSAYTGLRQVTVQGHASTPAMLYFMDGTSGYLKIRTGYNLIGTAGTLKGRILANSDGIWGNTGALAFANKAVIDLQGTSQVNATYLDIMMHCTNPTNAFVETYGTKIAVSSIDTGTDVITMVSAHGWTANTPVKIRSTETLPSPLSANEMYYVISPSGADLKLALYSSGATLDITSSGSGTIEIYSGHTSTATGQMNVLQDVSADPQWVAGAAIVLADAGPVDYDQQRTTISATSSTTITLGVNVDSVQYPGARIYLTDRNCAILSSGVVTAQAIVTASIGNTFGSIRNISTGTLYGYGLNSSSNNTVTTITGCSYGLNSSSNNTVTTITGCASGLNNSSNNTVTTINVCNTVSSGGAAKNRIKNVSSVTTMQVVSSTILGNFVIDDGTLSDANRFPMRIYTNVGTILPLVSGDTDFQTPDSGNSWVFEVTPNSGCGASLAGQIPYSPIDPIPAYATSGSKTLTYKIYPVGWSSSLDQDDVVLEVSYLDSASGITRTTVYNTSQTYAIDGWRSCSVTFSPAQDGIAYANLYVRKYESAAYLLIDPALTVA
jgi:hypothetical protein